MLPAPVLQVDDLRIAFGGREAVHGISFQLQAGETLGLVGESGSGKSAASLALMRLLPGSAAVTGRVLLGGPEGQIDLVGLPEEPMRRHRGRSLAMVFQEPMTALNPVMTIGRQVAEAWTAHHGTPGWRGWIDRAGRRSLRDRVVQALGEVALPDPARRLDDFPHHFSGGQRQRIAIAMALMAEPRVLIADEPTTALDVTVQAQVLALLRRLQAERGLAMVFISHDLAVVGQVAQRIAVMQGGRIVEQGDAHRLLTTPEHPYTRRLLAAAPTMRTPRDRPLAGTAAP